jgi:putative phosphoesterase
MRLGVISDIHSNSIALAAVLVALDQEGVDLIVCAGDIVGCYPYVNEAIDLLRKRDVICILGNHDCYLLGKLAITEERWRAYNLGYVDLTIRDDNRVWLAGLPTERHLELDGLQWHLCHGSPWAVEEYIYPDHNAFARFASVEAHMVVMGHTHIPLIRQVDHALLVNPGSCGQPRDYNPMAAYAVVDTATRSAKIQRVAYDVDVVCRRVAAEGFDQKFIEILRRTR